MRIREDYAGLLIRSGGDRYLHDVFTMKSTLNADRQLIPRTDYRIFPLKLWQGDFAFVWMRATLRFRRNRKRENIRK